MNKHAAKRIGYSACPHDCPSTCSLEIEILDGNRIGRVYGSKDNTYTAGVICAKVARYAERAHHPDRLLKPLIRAGAKGSGVWKEASFDAALDLVAEKFLTAEAEFGSESVWPFYYAGTMGLVQRDSINRLRHAKRYSNMFDTYCVNTAWGGYVAGTGDLRGPDPREMTKSDCVVIWGTNAVATQVNVMTHAIRARKERGAKLVVIDIYDNATMKQADLGLILRPGTDAALACATMHILFRDGFADRQFLADYTSDAKELEAHLQSRTPEWAAAITGLSVEEIEAFAKLVGETKRTFFRLGYGFTRQRNGSVNMHAALSIASVTGCWAYEGGGAFHSNSGIFKLEKGLIEGDALADPSIRHLDQSKIGHVLTGDREALYDGPPVKAMLIQNTNPANVAPEQRLVREGMLREDLFTCVHEQFMTDTAKLADVVLPATMFVEHDDIYRGGGNQYVTLGPKLIEPPVGPQPNLELIEGLAQRLGVGHLPGFGMSAVEHIDHMLNHRGLVDFATLKEERFTDMQPDFDHAHYRNGFAHEDGKFHFKPDWARMNAPVKPPSSMGLQGDFLLLPELPDHVELIELADEQHPFRLSTSPARSFLNSSFTEMPTSRKREGRPELLINPQDAAEAGLGEGEIVEIGNMRGEVALHVHLFDGIKRGVVIAEGLWPNDAHIRGEGINVLVGAKPAAPFGGLAVHDTKVWLRRAAM